MNDVASWSLTTSDGVVKTFLKDIPDVGNYYFSFCVLDPSCYDGSRDGQDLVYLDSVEPDFQCTPSEDIIKHHSRFKKIFTRRKDILESCSNAVLHPFGDCWLNPEPKELWENKDMSVSFTTTNKYQDGVDGYTMRHLITSNLNEIKSISGLPFYYYTSGRLPYRPDLSDHILGENRDPMLRHAFHLAVENSRCDNYFTEKLVDCFISKTVPIYFGTNDIGDYFNTDGMLIFNTPSDLGRILSDVTEDKWHSMQDAVEENYIEAKKYCHENGVIQRMIEVLKMEA